MEDAQPVSVDMAPGAHGDALRAALDQAHLPTLVAVLAHLTGDTKWIEPPFAPRRTRGMEDNADGGLPDGVRAHVLEAAFQLLSEPDSARSMPDLDDGQLLRILRGSLGEDVPADYVGMVRAEMGLEARVPDWPAGTSGELACNFRVLIIGAGASGLQMGITLSRLGISFEIVEKSIDLGGTWFDNHYPGCGVDTPSHLYSFSTFRNNWSRFFAKQPEIEQYLDDVARKSGVIEHIRFATTVTSAAFDDASGKWRVTLAGPAGDTPVLTVDALVSAVGQLNVPRTPTLPGQDRFEGLALHAARWEPSVTVTGKRVAVIGTGATAMQVVPAIAGEAEHVAVFQRSAHWVAPAENYLRAVPDGIRFLIDLVPAYGAWYRARLVWLFSDKIFDSLHIDPEWTDQKHSINAVNEAHRRYFTRYLTEKLGDRQDLIESLTPDYPPFGKRMLLDNDWFDTVQRPNVELVTAGIERVTPTGVLDANGSEHACDVIVYATGFDTVHMLQTYEVAGRDGRLLRDVWADEDPRAYLGMTVPGFPNFYCLYGPNTSLGHGGSLILLTECAASYVAQLLRQQILGGWRAVEVRAEVFDRYNRAVDNALAGMIWAHPGTTNWYQNSAGRVVTNSPWRVVDYWQMTRRPDLADYDIQPA